MKRVPEIYKRLAFYAVAIVLSLAISAASYIAAGYLAAIGAKMGLNISLD